MARANAPRSGALTRAHALRRAVLLAAILLASCFVLVRGIQLGILEGDYWAKRADAQHARTMELPAPRGSIFDRNGIPMASSRERYRLAVAPREVDDRAALIRALRNSTGLSAAAARSATDPRREWVVLSGRYDEPVRDALADFDGIYFETVLQRFYPHDLLAAQLLGRVSTDGQALGGVEQEYDGLLVGMPGSAIVRRGPGGRAIAGAMLRTLEPVAGHDVYLTIDHALQQIADDALRDALEHTGAVGGEVLLTDPTTGEVLAAASYEKGRPARNWNGVTVPYEPGSTLKPFTVAALLDSDAATLADSLYGEDGAWTVHGRTIRDVHAMGWMTLADALRESSNVGIAKTASRMPAAAQYAYLRSFGFGSPAGLPYPSESAGLLRHPRRWSRQSRESLAIGYEISVTPLQLAMAYGALANGGVLMEPRLVREVRTRDGRVVHSHEPRAVRRVVSDSVAAQLRVVLAEVVEEGTGRAASLGALRVAGKTGTVRIAVAGRYVPGAYIASFAGFFPAESPQLVFIVKLVEPKGAYYGGQTAAPVTRATLEAALAAQREPVAGVLPAKRASDAPIAWHPAERMGPALSLTPVRFVLGGEQAQPAGIPLETEDPEAVPSVSGLAVRDAVNRLHGAGLRVRVNGSGRALRTEPAAGARVKPGAQITLIAGGAP